MKIEIQIGEGTMQITGQGERGDSKATRELGKIIADLVGEAMVGALKETGADFTVAERKGTKLTAEQIKKDMRELKKSFADIERSFNAMPDHLKDEMREMHDTARVAHEEVMKLGREKLERMG